MVEPIDKMKSNKINKDLFVMKIQQLIGDDNENNEMELFGKLLCKAR
jgi:hypothetical protein